MTAEPTWPSRRRCSAVADEAFIDRVIAEARFAKSLPEGSDEVNDLEAMGVLLEVMDPAYHALSLDEIVTGDDDVRVMIGNLL